MSGLARRFMVPSGPARLAGWLVRAGAAAGAVGLFLAPEAVWTHVLLLGYFGIQLGLAGAVFIALQSVAGAGWSTAFRRVPEALTALVPVGGGMVLAALIFCPDIYPWAADPHALHGAFKHFWLSRPFFLVRAAVYVLAWIVMTRAMVAASRRQDADPSLEHTRRLTLLSAAFLVLFGLTYSLASFDWIMSREPTWVSTMFGVYQFAGLFIGGLSAILLAAGWLWRIGFMRGVYAEKHQHDLGKLLFGMSSFWVYIWFCQYMLIWYVNNPEETSHYITRQHDTLLPLFYINVVLNWGVPFVFLLPLAPKMSLKVLANVSVLVLLGRWLDLFLGLLPPHSGAVGAVSIGVLTAGVLGLYWLVFCRTLAGAALVPMNDPYLVESLPALSVAHSAHSAGAGRGGER